MCPDTITNPLDKPHEVSPAPTSVARTFEKGRFAPNLLPRSRPVPHPIKGDIVAATLLIVDGPERAAGSVVRQIKHASRHLAVVEDMQKGSSSDGVPPLTSPELVLWAMLV